MKNCISLLLLFICHKAYLQNVGIGTNIPLAKLHIKGSADTTQLLIVANTVQSNGRPLIKLRRANGEDLLFIHSDHPFNTYIGLQAGRSNAPDIGGTYNTFIGSQAGRANTSGNYNTATGSYALYTNVGGYSNTANGTYALYLNNNGINNIAVGSNALYSNVSGSANTAIGSNSLYQNTVGDFNTAYGYLALNSNVAGSNATALGYFAMLYSNSQAIPFTNDNVAVGYSALRGSATASANTGTQNTAIGYRTMENNVSGLQNTATGYKALHLNGKGSFNTATGGYALYTNSSGGAGGDQNTASGYASLYANNGGKYNTANGYYSLYNSNEAFSNTAIGHSAMLSTSTGSYNTAVGTLALEHNGIGDYNTAIGTSAGNDGTSDSYNISIGFNSHIAAGVSRSIVVGYNAFTNTNELALLGNPTTKYCGGYVGWTTFSDGRFKTEVEENVKGLEFIMRLRLVTFHMNVRAIFNLQGISAYGNENGRMTAAMKSQIDKSIGEKEAICTSGFIAQEVEMAAREIGYDFDGVKKPLNDKDNYALTYSSFVVPLVKAVQEQQQTIEALQKRMLLLEEQNDLLKKVLERK